MNVADLQNTIQFRDSIRPSFLGTVPVLWILKSSVTVPHKMRFLAPDISDIFKSCK